MKKLFIFLIVLLNSLTLFSAEENLLVASEPDQKVYNPRSSHLYSIYVFDTIKFKDPFEFNGEKKVIKPREQELYGGRIGFGGEVYLGGGLMTSTKLEGFFNGTLFSQVLNGGPNDESVKFAYFKKTASHYGAEISQSLSMLFDFKTKNPFLGTMSYLTLEPFVEAGLGASRLVRRVNYQYDTGLSPTAARESYKRNIKDSFRTTKLSIGINLISTSGFFLFIRATQNQFLSTSRDDRTVQLPNGGVVSSSSNNTKEDYKNIMSYTLGGGYKF